MDAHHVPSLKLYFTVFGILMVGTALTVAVAFFDLGAMNNVVMLTIAIVKATFVVLYFMHVRWSSRLTSFLHFNHENSQLLTAAYERMQGMA